MRWGLIGMLAAFAAVAIGAYAIGAGKPSKDLVLCANKKSGNLSLATAKGKCAKGEKKISVAKEGPVGPVGPAGPAGAAAASPGLEPVNLVKAGADDCATSAGKFCWAVSQGRGWENSSDGGAEEPSLSGYYKDLSGVVHLVGQAHFNTGGGGTGMGKTVFHLPPGFRPGQGVVSFSQPCGGNDQTVLVHGSGNVEIVNAVGCASFEGISFHP